MFTPKRARAYLVTDQAVSDTAAHYAAYRPALDEESQRVIPATGSPALTPESDSAEDNDSSDADTESSTACADQTLWLALCMAPEEGADIADLIHVTGMSRPTLYRRLAEHAREGRVIQVSRGHWRATTTEEPR